MVHVLVMMEHVMMLDLQPKLTFKIKMMDGVMSEIIKKITQKEADKERCYELIMVESTEESKEKKIKQCGKRNAYCWHHHQPFWIAGIIMMHAVKNKMYAAANFSFQLPVKYKTMQYIFCESPDEKPKHH